jgi:hypothetical protein
VNEEKFTKEELKKLKKLNTPQKVQEFLDSIKYNKGKRVSIAEVFRLKLGDCIESASFASFVLRLNGIKSSLMDLYCFDDYDHIVCVYKKDGLYGSVAQSLYLGLRGKSPVYKTRRELAMSYFEHFFNYNGGLDLKMISVPVKLPKKNGEWIFKKQFMYDLEIKIDSVKHIYIVPKNIKLPKITKEHFKRELMGMPKGSKIGKKYKCISKFMKKFSIIK